jgi:hypothetical protein
VTPAKRLIMMGGKANLIDNGTNYSNWFVNGGGYADANGVRLVANGTYDYAVLNTNLKPSTTYTLVYRVAESTVDGLFYMANRYTGLDERISSTVGVQKATFTTQETITDNQLRFYLANNCTDGTYVLLTDLAIYEGVV